MSHEVFLSYSSKDKSVAEKVCNVLECEGIIVWMAPRDILPGLGWAGSIISAINDAKVMVLLYSSNANTSPQIEREVERAANKGIPVVPFRIQDIPPSKTLEYFISSPHWLDAFPEPLEPHVERLADVVKKLLEHEFLRSAQPTEGIDTPAKPAREGREAAPQADPNNRISREERDRRGEASTSTIEDAAQRAAVFKNTEVSAQFPDTTTAKTTKIRPPALQIFGGATLIITLCILIYVIQQPSDRRSIRDITYSELLIQVEQGRVHDVTIRCNQITGHFADGRLFNTYAPDDPALVSTLKANKVQIDVSAQSIIDWLYPSCRR